VGGLNGEGPILIRAVVHARLFGVRLLTLDARVVVAEADPTEAALGAVVHVDPMIMPAARTYARERPGIGDHRATRRAATPRPDGGLRHARELLAQGADTLAGLRRPVD
jgi:hypothetical protein